MLEWWNKPLTPESCTGSFICFPFPTGGSPRVPCISMLVCVWLQRLTSQSWQHDDLTLFDVNVCRWNKLRQNWLIFMLEWYSTRDYLIRRFYSFYFIRLILIKEASAGESFQRWSVKAAARWLAVFDERIEAGCQITRLIWFIEQMWCSWANVATAKLTTWWT